jgi:hypothetical protein
MNSYLSAGVLFAYSVIAISKLLAHSWGYQNVEIRGPVDYDKVKKIIDCYETQSFITATAETRRLLNSVYLKQSYPVITCIID